MSVTETILDALREIDTRATDELTELMTYARLKGWRVSSYPGRVVHESDFGYYVDPSLSIRNGEGRVFTLTFKEINIEPSFLIGGPRWLVDVIPRTTGAWSTGLVTVHPDDLLNTVSRLSDFLLGRDGFEYFRPE